jgi:type IV pilus assembly protein PilE
MKFWQSRFEYGFSLIELLTTVAIIAILSAIALPIYSSYVLRAALTEAPGNLASFRLTLEQFYQDNHTYANGTACGSTTPTGTYFTYSCLTSNAGQSFVATATGNANTIANGYVYTVDQQNNQATSSVGTNAKCSVTNSAWVTKC